MLTPRFAATVAVERHYADVSHGAVHYRAAGDGPVVVALHESPRSSLSLLPVIAALADTHRVIAPDTPGYGLSDPLPDDAPEMTDFVAALAAFADALGLGRFALYGTHTGAAIAAAFAARYPARVAALILDGVSAFTPAEVATFRDRYLPPWQPRWDGGHVTALWSRCKDLATWFPWHDRSAATRLAGDPGDLAALDRSALGFVEAGVHYAKAYLRAAAFDPNTVLPGLPMPVTVMARPDDLIASHLDRLDAGPWRIRWLMPDDADWRAALREATTAGDAAPPPPVRSDGARFVPLGDGWLHAVAHGPPDGALRVVLPDLPGDAAELAATEASAHPYARVVAIDLPGCGRSDPLAAPGLDTTIAALDAVLAASPATLLAEGASLAVARGWATRRNWRGAIETQSPPAWLTGGGPVPARALLDTPVARWDGAHLTAAWFQLRDLMLYDVPPGCGAPVRRADPSTDVARLDRRFRALVEGPDAAALLEAIRRAAIAGQTG